jgi:Protein of unknwon function (DUF3310)
MPTANEIQVGGRHYKTEYEHWDLACDVGMGYLEGCATKYVARNRKKGGEEDLKKALHYVNKLIERQGMVARRDVPHLDYVKGACRRFSEKNGLTFLEDLIVTQLALWQQRVDLINARDLIVTLLEEGDSYRKVLQAQPVPLTDSNKHATRVGEFECIHGQNPDDCPDCRH